MAPDMKEHTGDAGHGRPADDLPGTYFSEGLPRPRPEDARLVQLCCQRLYAQEDTLREQFHTQLRDLVPGLPDRDSERMSAELIRSVLWSALSQEPASEIESELRSLGADHHGRGFPRDGYLGAGHALLHAARSLSDTWWSSQLSSAWVGHYAWLAGHLQAGADTARRAGGPPGPPGPAGPVSRPVARMSATAAQITTLDEAYALVRARYFADDARGLESVCTRVALLTGADLRAPQADQRCRPEIVERVLGILLVMGFSTAAVPMAEPPLLVPAPSPALSPRSRRRWLSAFRRQKHR